MRKTAAVLVALFMCVCLKAGEISDRTVYLDLMEEAVRAYSPERMEDYIGRIEKEGIREHGFARLTSNLGILIAHGRMPEMKDTFLRMMDLCVKWIPIAKNVNAGKGEIGNEFAVKEICCCIVEAESSGLFSRSRTEAWRNGLMAMQAKDIYRVQPAPGDEKRGYNWCVFSSASECARIMAGIGGDRTWADVYLEDQLRWFDSDGRYMDPHQPEVYDFVTRLQYMVALNFGYDGPSRARIEEVLLRSAEVTLKLQSVTGEIPYGGRSNQFLHNETFLAAVCEFYASWMKQRGDTAMASRFKAAAVRATASLKYWLNQKPVRHVKNRFPTETGYGCEKYAHFDKYMVTMGSWAYLAYRFADDGIAPCPDPEPASTYVTTAPFHRIMMNGYGYTVQIDLNAQKIYDSNGIGRFQKAGASPVVALASPCPTERKAKYSSDVRNSGPLSISPLWNRYDVVSAEPGKVVLTDGNAEWEISISGNGMKMKLRGSGEQRISLPVLEFDGESRSEIKCRKGRLSVSFGGSACMYRTNGKIVPREETYCNRNGHIRRFDAVADGILEISATIK